MHSKTRLSGLRGFPWRSVSTEPSMDKGRGLESLETYLPSPQQAYHPYWALTVCACAGSVCMRESGGWYREKIWVLPSNECAKHRGRKNWYFSRTYFMLCTLQFISPLESLAPAVGGEEKASWWTQWITHPRGMDNGKGAYLDEEVAGWDGLIWRGMVEQEGNSN